MRTLLFTLALAFSLDAVACPMADAAAYQTAAEAVRASDGTKATFQVAGLHCGSCSDKVTAALKGVEGVKAAAVDYQTGQALVAFDASKTTADKLLAAIQASGFSASKVDAKG